MHAREGLAAQAAPWSGTVGGGVRLFARRGRPIRPRGH